MMEKEAFMLKKLFITDSNNTIGLILRLTLGLVMFPHGAQKALGWFGGYGFDATLDFLNGQMGLPLIIAFLVILAEFGGSLGLIFGFLTKFSAFGIGLVMLGAVFIHSGNGFFMNWSGQQAGEGFEYHLLTLGISLALIITGGGKFSVDQKISQKLKADSQEM